MSELVYEAPQERKSKLARVRSFLEKMGPGVVQAQELSSGITPNEMKPHAVAAQNVAPAEKPVAEPMPHAELTKDQQAVVDEAENPLLPKE